MTRMSRRRPLAHALASVSVVTAAIMFVAAAPANASNTCSRLPCHLNYYGGAIMPSARTELVLWGSSTNASYNSTDAALLHDLAADSGTTGNVFSMLPEYSTSGLTPTGGAASSNQMLWYAQTYLGTAIITPSQCATAATCTVTEAQIRAELATQISSANLPAPTGNGMTTVYLVMFPPNVTVQNLNGDSSGVLFCATHGDTTLASGAKLIYALIPDDAGSGGCGADSNATHNETMMLTHELSETITDPLVEDSGNTIGAPISWLDPSNGEIGDMCNSLEATNTINGNSYFVQKEWSNAAGDCVSASNYGHPSADFSSDPNEPVTFNGSGSSPNGDHSIAQYAWDFGDGSSGSGATTTHAYAASGTYHVTLTATDSLGFITHVSHDVTALAPPPPPAAPAPAATGTSSSPPTTTSPAPGGGSSPGSITTSSSPPSSSLVAGAVVVTPGMSASCTSTGPCTARIAVTTRVKRRNVTIATAQLTITPGAAQKIKFKLSKAGAALLRKLKKLKATISVTLTSAGSTAPVVLTRTTTIKQPPARRRRA